MASNLKMRNINLYSPFQTFVPAMTARRARPSQADDCLIFLRQKQAQAETFMKPASKPSYRSRSPTRSRVRVAGSLNRSFESPSPIRHAQHLQTQQTLAAVNVTVTFCAAAPRQ